ncbi:MAG: hypothetical protein ABI488_18300 [Polyangiaceae bacterium]
MSKEEAERSIAQKRSSSLPPRKDGSMPPRVLPSTPPQTDDIDTDWGAEPAAAQTTLATEPVSPTFNAAAVLGATVSATGTPLAAPPPPAAPLSAPRRSSAPPPAAPPRSPSARPRPLGSQTLLGMPAPKPRSAPPEAPSAPPPAEPPPSEATATPLSATPLSAAPAEPSKHQSPLRSRTLLGMTAPVPTHAQEPPRAVIPTPEPEEQTAPERTRSSVPPPPLPPPASLPPGQRALREQVASLQPLAAASEPKGPGRALVWLAASCVGLGVLGYVVLHRSQPEPVAADVHAAAPAAAPAAPPEPELSAAAAPPPEPASTASLEASAAPPEPSAAPPEPSAGAPVPGMITVTVKSVPPKARIFHFGKQVGVAPWVVELKPGEHHAYEVGLPGRVTRKLVLDGRKTEITVGLKPDPVH